MGIPIVTMPGNRAASRQTAGFLRLLDRRDFIVASEDEYVGLCTRLAADHKWITEIRQRLRGRMLGSSLCDTAGFTRDLEAAYRSMWRNWCGRTPPAK